MRRPKDLRNVQTNDNVSVMSEIYFFIKNRFEKVPVQELFKKVVCLQWKDMQMIFFCLQF